jgi:hypothetical protein
MDIVSTPLIPDVEYFLDAAHEHGELDAGSLLVLKVYGPRRRITDIVDGVVYELGTIDLMRDRISKCEALAMLADAVLAELSPADRGPLASAGLLGLRHEITALASTLAQWAIEDEIKGGCLKPWKPKCTRHVIDYRTTRKQDRQLRSRKWIRRYVRLEPESIRLRRVGDRVRARLRGVDPIDHAANAERISEMLQAQHEGFRRTNERHIRNHIASTAAITVPRSERRKVRKIIKRAAICAESVLGRRAVSDFAAGRELHFSGQQVTLEVARVQSSAMLGHCGLTIRAVCPSTRRHLADLCVYHEQTPALDQAVALALAMQAGEEAEIISTANLSRVSDLGLTIPMIADRGWDQIERRKERFMDRRREVNEAYWQETKPVWLETLGVFSLGRSWQREWAA